MTPLPRWADVLLLSVLNLLLALGVTALEVGLGMALAMPDGPAVARAGTPPPVRPRALLDLRLLAPRFLNPRLPDRPLVAFAACIAGFHLANAAMLPLVASEVTRAAGSHANLVIAACIVVPQVIVALASPLVGRGAEAWGRRPVLLLGFLALPLRGALLALGGVYGAALILALADRSWVTAVLRWSPLYVIARLSFGMYLNHLVLPEPTETILRMLGGVAGDTPIAFVVGLLLTVIASAATAALTFVLVEQPGLALRDRWLANHSLKQPATA